MTSVCSTIPLTPILPCWQMPIVESTRRHYFFMKMTYRDATLLTQQSTPTEATKDTYGLLFICLKGRLAV